MFWCALSRCESAAAPRALLTRRRAKSDTCNVLVCVGEDATGRARDTCKADTSTPWPWRCLKSAVSDHLEPGRDAAEQSEMVPRTAPPSQTRSA
eukprot:212493-Pleurochrysis_carterae.AAC.8